MSTIAGVTLPPASIWNTAIILAGVEVWVSHLGGPKAFAFVLIILIQGVQIRGDVLLVEAVGGAPPPFAVVVVSRPPRTVTVILVMTIRTVMIGGWSSFPSPCALTEEETSAIALNASDTAPMAATSTAMRTSQ